VTLITPDTLASYFSGRLGEGEVTVTNLEEHIEGWSRDTVSFDVSYTADGEPRSDRLVIRAETTEAIAGGQSEGMEIDTEFAVMDAAQDAPVPVPETYWFEPDESVLDGRRFFVVEHLQGDAPVTWDPRQRADLYEAWDDPDRTLPDQFVDATVGVHTLSPQDIDGIEAVPRNEVVDRKIDHWEEIYRDTGFGPEPAIEEAIRWFRANKPMIPETPLVHGDLRIGNMLVDGDDLTGVLDWELACCGDPMFDLAHATTRYFAGKLHQPIERPELACSLFERDWYYDEYERRSGRPVDRERFRYWRGFVAFRMLTMGLDGAARFRDQGGSGDVRSGWIQYIVPGLIEDMLDIIREDRI
jgi:aminoglycoside phosphotransferase (APT) family kinase protein